MSFWKLEWDFGSALVRASAGLLWECEFRLPSGRRFQPFARAPWATEESGLPGQPAHMRYLGGEFVCVPFGIGGQPAGLLPQWQSPSWQRFNQVPHGYGADVDWQLSAADSRSIVIRADYPADDDIAFLTRRITADGQGPALDLELTIHARRPTRQPVGLHPILKLPQQPGQLRLEALFEFGITYPATVPPGVSRVEPGARFASLDSIPAMGADTVDYSSLPKPEPTEEMLMLCNLDGPVIARFLDERAMLRIQWDTNLLPSCLVWPSDSALADPPWNRSFRGVGVEPVVAVFDAAREVALESNPLNAAGVATAIDIGPDHPVTIRYRLEAADD